MSTKIIVGRHFVGYVEVIFCPLGMVALWFCHALWFCQYRLVH